MAHGFLSYQDPRGEVDYLDKIYKAIKNYLDGREKREKKAEDKGGALVKGPDPDPFDDGGPVTDYDVSVETPRSAPPLRKALAGSALQRTLPSAMATAAEVRGGPLAKSMGFSGKPLKPEGFVSDAIVNVDYQNLGVERDLPGDGMFVKSLSVIQDEIGDGSADVVEAIDNLTLVTTQLVRATEEQTDENIQIAKEAQSRADRLANRALARREENQLEKAFDLSGNSPFQKVAGLAGLGGSRGGGIGGFGAKAAAVGLGKAAVKRGAGRAATRLGAGIGMKVAGRSGAKAGAKLGAKTLGKVAGKKLPFGLGLAVAGGLAADRFSRGDKIGGIVEILSGLAAIVPGVGTAASLGIDGILAARDFGVVPFAEGGIPLGENVGALLNDRPDKAKEAVMPLTQKTFDMFGEGVMNAQWDNKKKYAKLQSLGLEEFHIKKNGWMRFGELMKKAGVGLFGGFKWPWEQESRDDDASGGRQYPGMNFDNIDLDKTKRTGLLGRVLPTAKGQRAPTITEDSTGQNKVSNFGQFRSYYNGGRGGYHMGADIGMDENSPVLAIQDGTVMQHISQFGKYGAGVVVKHDDGSAYVYGHVTPQVEPGDKVKAGDRIAKLVYYPSPDGTTDYTHLHLERFQVHGEGSSRIDPIAFMAKENITPPILEEPPEPPPKNQQESKPRTVKLRGAAGITDNYGFAPGQRFNFEHNGEEYHGYKTEDGWNLYKGRGLGATLLNTDGQNQDILNSFIRAGKSRTAPKIDPDDNPRSPAEILRDAQSMQQPDVSTPLAVRSREIAMATSASPAATVVNNYYSAGAQQTGGNLPADVSFGVSSNDMGNSWASELRLRTT
jgi:murein DD-endopeptidase MepM/ murein hydrolase activator NlpD